MLGIAFEAQLARDTGAWCSAWWVNETALVAAHKTADELIELFAEGQSSPLNALDPGKAHIVRGVLVETVAAPVYEPAGPGAYRLSDDSGNDAITINLARVSLLDPQTPVLAFGAVRHLSDEPAYDIGRLVTAAAESTPGQQPGALGALRRRVPVASVVAADLAESTGGLRATGLHVLRTGLTCPDTAGGEPLVAPGLVDIDGEVGVIPSPHSPRPVAESETFLVAGYRLDPTNRPALVLEPVAPDAAVDPTDNLRVDVGTEVTVTLGDRIACEKGDIAELRTQAGEARFYVSGAAGLSTDDQDFLHRLPAGTEMAAVVVPDSAHQSLTVSLRPALWRQLLATSPDGRWHVARILAMSDGEITVELGQADPSLGIGHRFTSSAENAKDIGEFVAGGTVGVRLAPLALPFPTTSSHDTAAELAARHDDVFELRGDDLLVRMPPSRSLIQSLESLDSSDGWRHQLWQWYDECHVLVIAEIASAFATTADEPAGKPTPSAPTPPEAVTQTEAAETASADATAGTEMAARVPTDALHRLVTDGVPEPDLVGSVPNASVAITGDVVTITAERAPDARVILAAVRRRILPARGRIAVTQASAPTAEHIAAIGEQMDGEVRFEEDLLSAHVAAPSITELKTLLTRIEGEVPDAKGEVIAFADLEVIENGMSRQPSSAEPNPDPVAPELSGPERPTAGDIAPPHDDGHPDPSADPAAHATDGAATSAAWIDAPETNGSHNLGTADGSYPAELGAAETALPVADLDEAAAHFADDHADLAEDQVELTNGHRHHDAGEHDEPDEIAAPENTANHSWHDTWPDPVDDHTEVVEDRTEHTEAELTPTDEPDEVAAPEDTADHSWHDTWPDPVDDHTQHVDDHAELTEDHAENTETQLTTTDEPDDVAAPEDTADHSWHGTRPDPVDDHTELVEDHAASSDVSQGSEPVHDFVEPVDNAVSARQENALSWAPDALHENDTQAEDGVEQARGDGMLDDDETAMRWRREVHGNAVASPSASVDDEQPNASAGFAVEDDREAIDGADPVMRASEPASDEQAAAEGVPHDSSSDRWAGSLGHVGHQIATEAGELPGPAAGTEDATDADDAATSDEIAATAEPVPPPWAPMRRPEWQPDPAEVPAVATPPAAAWDAGWLEQDLDDDDYDDPFVDEPQVPQVRTAERLRQAVKSIRESATPNDAAPAVEQPDSIAPEPTIEPQPVAAWRDTDYDRHGNRGIESPSVWEEQESPAPRAPLLDVEAESDDDEGNADVGATPTPWSLEGEAALRGRKRTSALMMLGGVLMEVAAVAVFAIFLGAARPSAAPAAPPSQAVTTTAATVVDAQAGPSPFAGLVVPEPAPVASCWHVVMGTWGNESAAAGGATRLGAAGLVAASMLTDDIPDWGDGRFAAVVTVETEAQANDAIARAGEIGFSGVAVESTVESCADLAVVPATGSLGFIDVPLDAEYHDAVVWATARDLLAACDEPVGHRFCPDEPVSGDDFSRIAGMMDVELADDAASLAAVIGLPSPVFASQQPTRAELVAWLWEADQSFDGP